MQKPIVQAAWKAFESALEAVADTRIRTHLLTLHLALRIRLGDPSAEPILEAAPLGVRLEVLGLAMAGGAPAPGVAAIARRAVAEAGEHATLADRAVGVWAGAGMEALRQIPMLDRIRGLALLVRCGFPADLDALEAWLPVLERTEADVVLMQWFGLRPFAGTGREVLLLDSLSQPTARLEAMALVAGRHAVAPELAGAWADATAEVVRAAGPKLARVLAQARWSGLAARAGRPTAESGYKAALGDAGRLTEPMHRAAAYRALFGAVAAGLSIAHWESLCDAVAFDPGFMPHPHHFLATRATAARLMPRWAARAGEVSALDRGYTAFRATGRRVREPWVEVLGHAIAARLMEGVEGRSGAVPLAAIADAVRVGLPKPIAEATLEEILAEVAPVAPEWCLTTAELATDPLRRALWLATALPLLG